MIMPFFVMSALQAAQFNQATAGRTERLEPVLVRGGTDAGKYALPTRVEADPAFEDLAAAFAVMTPKALAPDVAFPPVQEE